MFENISEIKTYVIPISVFLLCNAAGLGISRLIFAKLIRLSASYSGIYQDVITRSLKGMPAVLGVLAGSYTAVTIIDLSAHWLHLLEKIAVVIGVLAVSTMAARILSGVISIYDGKLEGFPSASIVAHLAEAAIYMVGFLIVLQNLGFSITPILTALGVGGLAVALALQDTLSNLFSGLHILVSKHIRVGDYIKLSTGEEGNVVDISWRNTTIQGLPNTVIIVPNQKIASAIVTNYFMPDKELSILVSAGVSYDSDLEKVEKVTIDVAKEVLLNIEGGIAEFEPMVRFHTFGDFSINFNVVLRVREFANQYLVKHEFIKRLHVRYRQEGIEIPFPIRTVRLKQMDES